MVTIRSCHTGRAASAVGLLMLIAFSFAAGEPVASDSGFFAEIRRLEETHGGHLGFAAKDLRTGETISSNGSERFPTASLIKLPILAAFFQQVERGAVNPSERIYLQPGDKRGGSGVLQSLSDSASLTLLDAVRLMISLSDNTATNLVLDRLEATHDRRLGVVNDFLAGKGLANTRLLNRLYSLETKKLTPEAIRYGIGVATPEDMVLLLEQLHRKTLLTLPSCDAMLGILKGGTYGGMIPRFLPAPECTTFAVAHKTGGITESKTDAGLVLTDRIEIAMAIFVDKHPDHSEGAENRATLLVARVARAIWNHFTGMSGYDVRWTRPHHVDWNSIPGGSWGMYRSPAAPFPHPARESGWKSPSGTFYPRFPHYADSSVIVFVPEKFMDSPGGANVIVHFHGHNNDNLGALEQDRYVEAIVRQRVNALLVFVQGPYRAADSFSGKMEDEGGFKRFVEDVLRTMHQEEVVKTVEIREIIVSGFSGGYRPAAFVLERGGLSDKIRTVFLFDALYAYEDFFANWAIQQSGVIYGAYTDHLEPAYTRLGEQVGSRTTGKVHFTKATVGHGEVVKTYVEPWLSGLGPYWKITW